MTAMKDDAACVDFLQRLIRTPSLPGKEGDVAELVRAEMESLGYHEIKVDEVGNVIGLIRGSGDAPAVMLNTHLDHVDVGEPGGWPHAPYGGEIHDGKVWGRGAVDIKGPLAAQVHGAAQLLQRGLTPAGDLYVSTVVQEEIGGVGARHLIEHLQPPIAVIGEPSSNELRRGHRGRSELILHIRGRSVHASVPGNGINPFSVLARFLARLDELELAQHPDLGRSSVAPTLIHTDQTSSNVIPGALWLCCDWRHVPGETGEDARVLLQAVAAECLIEGAAAEVSLPVRRHTAYTGVEIDIQGNNPAYVIAVDDPALLAARDILQQSLGRTPAIGTWGFATDGGHFAKSGITCIGFAPGDESLAHTVNESIAIEELGVAVEAYAALALKLGAGVSIATQQAV